MKWECRIYRAHWGGGLRRRGRNLQSGKEGGEGSDRQEQKQKPA